MGSLNAPAGHRMFNALRFMLAAYRLLYVGQLAASPLRMVPAFRMLVLC